MIYLYSKANTKFSCGQALSESFILLGIFSLLYFGIQVTSSTQLQTVDALLNSLKHAFEISLGKLTHSGINHEIYTFESHQNLSHTVRHVFDDLLMAQPGLIRFSVSSKPLNNYVTSVTRSTFVDTGYGHSDSDHQVQQKIAESSRLWLDAFQLSSKQMKEIHKHTSRVDHAWQRPSLNIDFIQPWEGAIPEQATKRNHVWND